MLLGLVAGGKPPDLDDVQGALEGEDGPDVGLDLALLELAGEGLGGLAVGEGPGPTVKRVYYALAARKGGVAAAKCG